MHPSGPDPYEEESAAQAASRRIRKGRRIHKWLKIIGGLIAAILAGIAIVALGDDDDDDDDNDSDNDSMRQTPYQVVMYLDDDTAPNGTIFAELQQRGYTFKDRQVLSATEESQIWRNDGTATLIEIELLEDNSWDVRAISAEKLWCLSRRGEALHTTDHDFLKAQSLFGKSPLKQLDTNFWQVELGNDLTLRCYFTGSL